MPTPERLQAALADRYRIERELGAGGMANVYLAEDLKHGRKVALKVLKPELAAVLGAERFVVEIKTTAALQHPHILPLFDSGTADGFLFYVMPFIDGETLRDKLNRETQFSVDEAVRITREVAEALHYAHAHGVIHRDIKPENILLANGRPMVADFGIALAVSAAAGGRMTETGLSLGTPHYMSPEQATAEKEITGRSDVYSLASVCYEMLTGNPPHVGSSAQQIIMRIITEQPEPVTLHRKTVPPHVAAAVAKALEKLPADRFESAEKFAEALANPAFTTVTGVGAQAMAARGAARAPLLAASVIAAVATVAAVFLALRPQPEQPVTRFQLALPDSQMLVSGYPAPVPAPDGSFLVYHGPVPGNPAVPQLWIKRRDQATADPIPGSVGAGYIAISPDGRRLAFDNSGRVRIMPVTGGASVVVAEPTALPFGIAWLDNERVLYTAAPADNPSLMEIFLVPASGGESRRLGLLRDGRAAVLPSPIAGRDAFLFLSCASVIDCDLHVFDLRTDSAKALVSGSLLGVHAASGHLLFERGGALLAVRFDASSLEMRGDPVQLFSTLSIQAPGSASIGADGTMIAMNGGSAGFGSTQEFVWVDRNGRQEQVDPAMGPLRMTVTGSNHGWSLSPDGSRVAIGLATASGDDIWVKQLPRGPLTRATIDAAGEFRPRWMPDGKSLVFPTVTDVRVRRADGTGRDSVILRGQLNEVRMSPDGKWLLARGGAASSVDGGRDILAMRIGVDTALRPLLATQQYDETAPSLSPDGNWLLYQSNESGRRELFVRPFPDVDRVRVQVSLGGGEAPLWSRNGREIFFLSLDRQMMAVDFTAGTTPVVSEPRALFPVPRELLAVETAFYTPWDVAPDGRFLMTRSLGLREGDAPVPIVTYNLFAELRRLLPR